MKSLFFKLIFCLVTAATTHAWASEYSIYSELVSYSTVRKNLSELKKHSLALQIAVPSSSLNDPELYSLIESANQMGVQLRAWLLLPDSKGYWPNMHNAQAFAEHTRNFLDEIERRRLTVQWVTVDMEPTLGVPSSAERAGRSYDEQFSHAEGIFTTLVGECNRRGVKVQVVTMAEVLHDTDDGLPKMQKHMGLPILNVPWDEVSVMIYRPFFHLVNPFISERIVYYYSQKLYKAFGHRGAVAIGPIGVAGKVTTPYGYTRIGSIEADISAARAAGIEKIHFFSLDGMLILRGISHWMQTITVPARIPDENIATNTYVGWQEFLRKGR